MRLLHGLFRRVSPASTIETCHAQRTDDRDVALAFIYGHYAGAILTRNGNFRAVMRIDGDLARHGDLGLEAVLTLG